MPRYSPIISTLNIIWEPEKTPQQERLLIPKYYDLAAATGTTRLAGNKVGRKRALIDRNASLKLIAMPLYSSMSSRSFFLATRTDLASFIFSSNSAQRLMS